MADYKILTIPFARDAVPDMVNNIPETPSPSEPQLASYRQGFPVITTIPLVAGGLPPEGQDFNGILRDITQHIVHQNQGGMYKFAPKVVAAGGYAKGAVLASNDDLSLWVSLQNNNVQDFNTNTPTQWARIAFSGLDALLNAKADKAVSINAGTGLTGGGTLGASLSLALGTPGTISPSSTNSVTATSHTHAITLPGASTSAQGIVQLNNTLTSTSTSQALTAAQGKQLQDTKQDNINAGSTAQYWRGDKNWRDFATDVRAAVLTGLSTATNSAIAAADTVLAAFGKLQAQITALATSKLDTTANAVSATKLATARTIALGGDLTGSVAFDGSTNVLLDAALPARLGKIAQSITDWDLATENGYYQGNDALNAPSSGWLIGHVFSHGGAGWVTQDVHAFTSDSPADSKAFRRERNIGTWGSWYRLRTTEAEQSAIYLNASNLNAGTVPVARGGTGATATTGTGDNVLSASPALTGVPTAPTAAAGTKTTQIASTAFVQSQVAATVLGVNQTWQDVTAQRSLSVTYTNTTGRPIMVVQVSEYLSYLDPVDVFVNGVKIVSVDQGTGPNWLGPISFVVPVNASYRIEKNISPNIRSWVELR